MELTHSKMPTPFSRTWYSAQLNAMPWRLLHNFVTNISVAWDATSFQSFERNDVWLPENATICATFKLFLLFPITMLSFFLIFGIIFIFDVDFWMMLFEFKLTSLKLLSTNRLPLNKFKTREDNSEERRSTNIFFHIVYIQMAYHCHHPSFAIHRFWSDSM